MSDGGGEWDSTLRASHDHAAVRSNINACDGLIVAFQLIFEGEAIARVAVQFDIIVSCYSERLTVGREGVVGNGVVEEMVDFGSGHDEEAIGVALYYRLQVSMSARR